jgi:hypothetical protein
MIVLKLMDERTWETANIIIVMLAIRVIAFTDNQSHNNLSLISVRVLRQSIMSSSKL